MTYVSKQWNCDKCDFQATNRAILLNHCKLAQGHQPSRQKQRLGQNGVLECYTCKSEFRSYHDLMNHRKEEHPSHKKCRYFLQGACNFSKAECWYLHEDGSTGEHNSDVILQCNVCKKTCVSTTDIKEHMKTHQTKAFKPASTTNPQANAWATPLQKVHQHDFYQPQPSAAPDQGALIMTLNLINQRLQIIENRMFPQQI